MNIKPTFFRIAKPIILILGGIGLLISLLAPESVPLFQKLLTGAIIGLLSGLFFGYLLYLQVTVWHPRKVEKFFSRKTFMDLTDAGFVRNGHVLQKTVRGYAVPIQFIPGGSGGTVSVRVLFDPRTATGRLTIRDINEFSRRTRNASFNFKGYDWNMNSVSYDDAIVFGKLPSAKKILERIEAMINILEKENLKPISFAENEIITADQNTNA